MSQSVIDCESWLFCEQMLPPVSRSFALIIPQCPTPIDQALCISYLICRIADTIEDDAALDESERGRLYDALLWALEQPDDRSRTTQFHRLWSRSPEGAYGELIDGMHHVVTAYGMLSPEFQRLIDTCVREMTEGMRSMQPVETRNGIQFMCRNLHDLDRYCHYVAGTVGIMATSMFEMQIDNPQFQPTDEWRENGRVLGLGLQMTNIIKDCCVDADRGVSYLPSCYIDFSRSPYRLHANGRAELIEHTIKHLNRAMCYIQDVPVQEVGIRTFLLGSLLPAIATLEVAASGVSEQPKIDRMKMAEISICIDRHMEDNNALYDWYAQHRQRTLDAVQTQLV